VLVAQVGPLLYGGVAALYGTDFRLSLTNVREMWSYDKNKCFDNAGKRWHFVRRDFSDPAVPYEDRPVELYFRDDERTTFGVLRFARRKDIPFRNYEVMIKKIMNDLEFRAQLIKTETKAIWNRNWK